ncbi:MAG TPA: hypothetical protein VJ840_05035 [Gemmatimonadaceae bacterium]|nr:hypothetical protein [Gemmatimonadaceae bacterium]
MSTARPLVIMGFVGIVLGIFCYLVHAVRGGAPIPPEGDLTKAASFDLAVGIYAVTLAFLLPEAGFSERGKRRWIWWHVALLIYAFTIETVQIFRGVDPRFSKVAGPLSQILGLIFFLQALTILVLFLIMAVRFFRARRPDADSPLLLAIRYGCVAALGAFAAGIWMSAIQGRRTGGAGNILPLHALGFHGLQAVPLIALLLMWAGVDASDARRWVHITGVAWLIACAAVAQQTIVGRSIFDTSPAMMVAAFVLVVWAAGGLFALVRWMRVPIRSESPDTSRTPI